MDTLLFLHLILFWALKESYCDQATLSPKGPVIITNGGTLALTCQTDQNATSVLWIRNNTSVLIISNTTACSVVKVPPAHTYNYSVTCDQHTKFDMMKYGVNSSDDNSTWSCQVFNPSPSMISSCVRVLMYVPVDSVQLKNGTTLTLIENQSAALVCETAACRPSADIYWMKDGVNITDSPTTVTPISYDSEMFVSIGSLYYTGQRRDNQKLLTCGAYNGQDSRKTSANLTINIYYAPSIDRLTSPYKVIESQPLNVNCVVTSNPPADRIFWSPRGEGSVNSTLYFSSVSRNKSGIYNCTAQNTMIPTFGSQQTGISTSQMQVDVLYPPSIGVNSPYKVIESQPLNVNCVVTSNPPADIIFWSPRGEGSVNSILYFSSVSRNKSGMYNCTAHNTMTPTVGTQQNGNSTSQIQVDVLYPPSIDRVTSPYKVIENQPLNVNCVATSNPPADGIFWSPKGEGSVNTILYFSSVSRNKSGIYNCTAQNTMIPTTGTQQTGNSTSQIKVDVLYPPSIEVTSPYKVIESQPLNVNCVVNSNPPTDQIFWSPKGEGSIETILYFNSMSRNKSGIYNCTAQNTMIPTFGTQQTGINTSQIQVDVLYPPSIDRLTSPYKVIESQLLTVNCVATSNPPADRIFWSPRGEGSANSTLYFSSVSRNKSGIYNCTAQNTMIPTFGTQQTGISTSQIQVDVLYGAAVVNLTVHDGNTVNENSSAIFNCHVDSNPPSTINWTKEDNSSTVLKTESGVLQSDYTIISAECLDMGNYTCIADNGILTTSKERLELFVRCHPRTDFRLSLETKLYRKRHEAAILRYTVISYPPPTFTWTFLGNGSESKILPVSASQHDNGQQSELRITNLNITDFGNYSVIANNSLFPSATVVFEILQGDFPDVPSNVTINGITQTSVKVQWMAGYNGGPQQTFHIVASAGSSTYSITADDPGYRQTGTAVLNGLLPGTKYSIYVVAINLIGRSNITQAINVTTLEDETSTSSPSPISAVAGGVAGAIVAVILLVGISILIWRRYQHKKSVKEQIYENATHVDGSSNNVYEGLSNTSGENAYDTLGEPNGTCVEKDSLLYVNLMLNPLTNRNGKPNINTQNNQTEAVQTTDGRVGEST